MTAPPARSGFAAARAALDEAGYRASWEPQRYVAPFESPPLRMYSQARGARPARGAAFVRVAAPAWSGLARALALLARGDEAAWTAWLAARRLPRDFRVDGRRVALCWAFGFGAVDPPGAPPAPGELDVDGAADAWERLACAGLVPLEAVAEPARRVFEWGWLASRVDPVARTAGGAPTGRPPSLRPDRCAPRPTVGMPTPSTVAAAVLLAADWPEVLAAEALARQEFPGARVAWCRASLLELSVAVNAGRRHDALRRALAARGYGFGGFDGAQGIVRLLAEGC